MAEFVRAAVAVIQMQHGLTKKWVIHTLTPLIASLRGGTIWSAGKLKVFEGLIKCSTDQSSA